MQGAALPGVEIRDCGYKVGGEGKIGRGRMEGKWGYQVSGWLGAMALKGCIYC